MADSLEESLCHGRAWHDRWIGHGGWKGMGGFIFPVNDLLHFPVITNTDYIMLNLQIQACYPDVLYPVWAVPPLLGMPNRHTPSTLIIYG